MKNWYQTLAALAGLLMLAGNAGAATLEDVKERGTLRCGVNSGLPGLSERTAEGRWQGLDVDLCRAVAAAALGDAKKVEFVPLTNRERLQALADRRIDLLARNTTWNLSRDLGSGVDFVGINYYDGQGLMVRKSQQARSVLELDGVRICVQAATTSEAHIKDYFTANRMGYTAVYAESPEEALQIYADGGCDALTSDQSQLYGLRTRLPDPSRHRILPEVISKEPLGPAVRDDDPAWRDLVRWSLYTMINAEELKVTSANVDRVREQAAKPAVRGLLDLDGSSGKALGIAPQWGYRIVKQVGNYGESFERNLGKQSPLKIKRGLNALWNNGGLLYAPPSQ